MIFCSPSPQVAHRMKARHVGSSTELVEGYVIGFTMKLAVGTLEV